MLTTSSGLAVPVECTSAFLASTEADALFVKLRDETPWAAKQIEVGGRATPMTRLICWIGDTNYDFYGTKILATPWTPKLASLRDRLEANTHARYNSVLLNLYRDGSDLVDWHADDEAELGETPTIASISLGSSRRFQMRHNASGETVGLDLEHGSLAVMSGDSQAAWKHSIPKTAHDVGPRINLTFRWFEARSCKHQ